MKIIIEQALKKIYSKLSEDQKAKTIVHYRRLQFFHKNISAELMRFFMKNKTIENINLFEQRFSSQNGEDGIIKIILDKVKPTNRFCVEFGVHPNEGNTILLEKKGWTCLFMDGNGDGSRIKKEFITAENINSLFKKYDVPKELDLLSIDIDSYDYWVWKALTDYSPRIVVIEYNSSLPPTESKTIEYNPNVAWDGTSYFGASLLALVKLGKSKGYTLIGCDNRGVNAFFVRNDLVENNFAVKDITKLYKPPRFGTIVNGKHIGHPPSDRSMISV